MCVLYLPIANFHFKFPFLTWFQRISLIPRFCEILRNAVRCYGVGLLATRTNNKLQDSPCCCLQLFIQYINSNTPYVDAISSIASWQRATQWRHGHTYYGSWCTPFIVIIIIIIQYLQ